jgi:hypothetical protein
MCRDMRGMHDMEDSTRLVNLQANFDECLCRRNYVRSCCAQFAAAMLGPMGFMGRIGLNIVEASFGVLFMRKTYRLWQDNIAILPFRLA